MPTSPSTWRTTRPSRPDAVRGRLFTILQMFNGVIMRVLTILALLALSALLAGKSLAFTPPRDTAFFLATKVIERPDHLPHEGVYALPEIDGVFIRIPWDVIRPTADGYDWALFDRVAKPALAAGKVLSLGIVTGDRTPRWLADAGVPFGTFEISRRRCHTVSVPHPWDPDYVAAYVGMMRDVRDHLASIGADGAVTIVKMTAIAQHTLELRLPRDNACSATNDRDWAAAGYRPSKVVEAWEAMADGVAALYPDALIVQPILQAQGFPAIGEDGDAVLPRFVDTGSQIIASCIELFASRCGVQWNALKFSGRVAERVLEARDDGATIGWQTNLYEGPRVGAGCQTDRRAPTVACTAETYAALLARGFDLGADFIEVWEPDVEKYPEALAQARRHHQAVRRP